MCTEVIFSYNEAETEEEKEKFLTEEQQLNVITSDQGDISGDVSQQ